MYYKGSAPASLATSALEDDNYYIFSTDFTQATVKIVANKVTIVNNAKVIGSNINGTAQTKGTQELTTDLGILSGRNNTAYVVSSKHKIIWIKFYDKQGALMHEFNFSEGAGETTYDVVTGNAYPISNINLDPAAFWNYKQDFNHYNFRYGFTLYQKSGSPDIRIPNKKDGSEIILPAPPTGYTRIANYKECRQTFNQCENVFKLDNVAEVSRDVLAVCPDSFYNGLYVRQNDELYICTANNSEISISGGTWRFRNRTTYAIPYLITRVWPWQTNPALENWSVVGVTCSNPVVFSNQDLYNADVDHVLFTANTGVAKQINIGTLDVDLNFNRGHMYINPNIREHDFMLYKTNKTLKDDEKILKYIGLGDEILTDDKTGETIVDENDHVILE